MELAIVSIEQLDGFDLDACTEAAKHLNQEYREVTMDMGLLMLKAKELLPRTSEFGAWRVQVFPGISKEQASRYMRNAKNFGGTCLTHLPATLLDHLAKAPDEYIEQVAHSVKRGELPPNRDEVVWAAKLFEAGKEASREAAQEAAAAAKELKRKAKAKQAEPTAEEVEAHNARMRAEAEARAQAQADAQAKQEKKKSGFSFEFTEEEVAAHKAQEDAKQRQWEETLKRRQKAEEEAARKGEETRRKAREEEAARRRNEQRRRQEESARQDGQQQGKRRRYQNNPEQMVHHRALEILGLNPPTEAVIKAAYKIAASKNHPDKGGTNEEMQAINAAKDFLMKQLKE